MSWNGLQFCFCMSSTSWSFCHHGIKIHICDVCKSVISENASSARDGGRLHHPTEHLADSMSSRHSTLSILNRLNNSALHKCITRDSIYTRWPVCRKTAPAAPSPNITLLPLQKVPAYLQPVLRNLPRKLANSVKVKQLLNATWFETYFLTNVNLLTQVNA